MNKDNGYGQFSLRLPAAVRHELAALAIESCIPQNEIVIYAVETVMTEARLDKEAVAKAIRHRLLERRRVEIERELMEV
jgi:hypothetical protein